MDKYENKIRLDELKQLVGEKRYEHAADLCDTINWKKIKNVSALMQAGEAYANVGRYEEAQEVLLTAYDRSPVGRMIVYRLAEIAIKMKNFEEAEEYYEEFVDIAPHDNLRYVLRYEMLKAQGASIEEKIALLEEFKEEEYTEQWAFELAYLYHKAGDSEKCIDACDELVLWFGDGPYVEKALELKMLYQPLNKIQEQKYRDFRVKAGSSFVEIHANDRKKGGEVSGDTVVIPDISVNTEKYNTVNLQQELAKSMEQIANATEPETVSDTMDMIKKMVEEIPYLALESEEEQEAKEEEKKVIETAEKQINEEITANFENYLAEEIDGQMSLNVQGGAAPVRQITGQLSIDEILAEWEMTQRAAEAALADANQKKLEVEKTKALQEADDIMKRLSEMIPDLDAGLTPKDILEKKYTENLSELVEKDEEEATRVVENMTDILQQQIDKLTAETEEAAASGIELTKPVLSEESEKEESGKDEENVAAEEPEEEEGPKKWVPKKIEEVEEEEPAPEELPHEKKIVPFVPPVIKKEEPEPPVIIPEIEAEKAPEAPAIKPKEPEKRKMTETGSMPDLSVTIDTASLPVIDLPPEEPEPKKEPEKTAEEKRREEGITGLSEEEKEIFSYFTLVGGVEEQVTGVLSRTEKKIMNTSQHSGHILVQSAKGNGKTQLATDFVKVLQKRAGRKMGHVGRIEAAALNQKDIPELLKKVKGGVLIIENAGALSRETAVKLSLQLQSDTSGLLVIMEDTREGLAKALSTDTTYAEKFTERIIIPVFSMDELVEFAKAYAKEQFYEIDEMAVLALYDRITQIEKLDSSTTLAEVKEIVDDAIAKAEKISFRNLFSSKKAEDNSDYTLLREKDFE